LGRSSASVREFSSQADCGLILQTLGDPTRERGFTTESTEGAQRDTEEGCLDLLVCFSVSCVVKGWALVLVDATSQGDHFRAQRERMVRTQLAERGIRDVRVLDAMRKVPRHEFVPESLRQEAYEDHPLPIGEGQTISQPYIVAAMLERLALQAGDQAAERVLEVGTGSGYVTALLSLLCAEVYSVERHAQLAASAESTLRRLGYRNVKIRVGDGSRGWPEYAPFDAILVSAATPEMPPALFAQLREGGRMMVPVGPASSQELQLIRKIGGEPEVRVLEGCRFVPLVEGTVGSG
jgi:protein-L-isoaspartate(D-aspartate) O-methyltransferase